MNVSNKYRDKERLVSNVFDAWEALRLQYVQNDDGDDEDDRYDGRHRRKHSVDRSALLLAEERFRAAGDSAREVLALPVLHEHRYDEKQGEHQQHDAKNNLYSSH